MKKKLVIALIIIVITGTAFGYYFFGMSSPSNESYKTAELIIGDIENTISSSGTLSPISAVEIGTQVSGTVADVFVDFNDEVKKGQLLAVLDTTLLKVSILDAEASLEKTAAQLELAQVEHDKNYALYEKNLISELEYLPYKIDLRSQKASMKSAEAALDKAIRNLGYAYITSPITGAVIEKEVEGGQTVAASYSTPTLFIIAENLSKMEIQAAVDESDIGEIKKGQKVRFEVQAYPDEEFEGTVTQVRLQPETVSNVVTYTVIIDADNDDNLLLPGMTATIDFITESSEDALLVPSSALSFQPSQKIMEKLHKQREKEREALPDSIKEAMSQRRQEFAQHPPEMNADQQMGDNSQRGQIWYLDSDGNINMEPVHIGMSDGKYTEITRSRDLTEGITVITGYASDTDTESSSSQQQNGMHMGGPMGGGPPPRF